MSVINLGIPLYRKIHLIFILRGHTQTMWTAMGGGGLVKCPLYYKGYLVKLSTKGEGSKNRPHGLCKTP